MCGYSMNFLNSRKAESIFAVLEKFDAVFHIHVEV